MALPRKDRDGRRQEMMVDSMSRGIMIIVAVIGTALLLFGCLGTVPGGTAVPGGTNDTNQNGANVTNATTNLINQTPVIMATACENLTAGREDCIIRRAFDNDNYSDCLRLNGSFYTECVYKLAGISYSSCLYLKSSNAADDCLLNMTSMYGLAVCNNVINKTKKEECVVLSVAPNCSSLANPDEMISCDAIAKNNESICDKSGNDTDRDNCYLGFSLRKRDVCKDIGNEGVSSACVGLLNNSTSYCAAITSGTVIRDNCYKTYAEESGNCSLCTSVLDSVYKDDCFVGCAVDNDECVQCAGSSDEQKSNNCYWQCSVDEDNISFCSPITLYALSSLCMEQIATNDVNPSECNGISKIYGYSESDVASCYLDILTATNVSLSNCKLMDSGYDKDLCINEAIRHGNLSKDNCAYIADDALKSSCYAG